MSLFAPSALMISGIDTAIVLAYLAGMVLLGIWIGRGSKDVSDYLLGGGKLPWWAVLGSIVATETSTATFLSVPGLSFASGGNLSFLQLAFGYVLGRFLVAIWLIPLYFEGRLFTAYEVLHRRFGGWTQKTASLIFLVTRNIGDGLRLFLTAIVVREVAGVSDITSIVVVGVCTIAYTFVGGIRAVIWSDCVQLVIYVSAGVVAFLLIASMLPGGWTELWTFARSEGKLTVINTAWDFTEKHTLWAGLIGGTLLTLGTHGTDQMMVQRYLCTSGVRDASRALICSGFVVILQFALFLSVGVALAAFEASHPSGIVMGNDRRFIHFIVTHMPTVLVGFTIAGIFSAAMSTLSSSLNSSAGAVVSDFVGNRISPAAQLRATQFLTLVFGVIQMAVAIEFASLEINDSEKENIVSQVLSVAGFSSGLLVGVFTLGVATKHVGQVSALIGMLAGAGVLTYVRFWTDIAWPWHTLIGATATIVTGLLASIVNDLKR